MQATEQEKSPNFAAARIEIQMGVFPFQLWQKNGPVGQVGLTPFPLRHPDQQYSLTKPPANVSLKAPQGTTWKLAYIHMHV